ncbi:MAG: IMP dehydrogenase [Chloroflexi bacterium]|jgi:IMP dehydrogenase|nr:MAG: IMP dehydrogenase [Chloroflexota bacterium]
MSVPEIKELSRAYGFDEVAIAPGEITINPDQTNTEFSLSNHTFKIPIISSAMDAIGSPKFAGHMEKSGGLSVMNLEGIQTRYSNPSEPLSRIIDASDDDVTSVLQEVYSGEIDTNLVGERVQEIKATGARCAVSITPASTKKLAPLAAEAGADLIFVQSTVTTARHISKSKRGLIFSELLDLIDIPVIVGNCISYNVALELMETGVQGILVGVGPGAACTTREVTGVGVPQVTATLQVSAARDNFLKQTGKYVPVITDGGIRTGGDVCKSFVAGADAIMIGSPLAQSEEAPGGGYNWGMASPHPRLPRGTRVNVGTQGPLEQILFGPTSKTNGTQNLIGALEECMGMVGAFNIREMQKAKMIIAPSIKTEGKYFQMGGS